MSDKYKPGDLVVVVSVQDIVEALGETVMITEPRHLRFIVPRNDEQLVYGTDFITEDGLQFCPLEHQLKPVGYDGNARGDWKDSVWSPHHHELETKPKDKP